MDVLNEKRLSMFKRLLDELAFFTDDEVLGNERDALCININEFCLYPEFQFDDEIKLKPQLRRHLSTLRSGRDDADVIMWLLTEKTVLLERAVAPFDLVKAALESVDFEEHERLTMIASQHSRFLTARPVDLLDSKYLDVFVDDWRYLDDRVIPTKVIAIPAKKGAR